MPEEKKNEEKKNEEKPEEKKPDPSENASVWAEREKQFRDEIARKDATIAEKDKIIKQLMTNPSAYSGSEEKTDEEKALDEVIEKLNKRRRF